MRSPQTAGIRQFVKVIEGVRKRTPSGPRSKSSPPTSARQETASRGDRRRRARTGASHNLETVPRLYPTIRPGGQYYASLRLLESVKRKAPHIFTKSGGKVGLGEQRLEVHQVMDDMRSAGVDFLTMGRYLQPTSRHATVEESSRESVRRLCGDRPRQGIPAGRASPLTRSSYHAGDDFKKMGGAQLRSWRGKARMPRHSETKHLPYTPKSDRSRTYPATMNSCPG